MTQAILIGLAIWLIPIFGNLIFYGFLRLFAAVPMAVFFLVCAVVIYFTQ